MTRPIAATAATAPVGAADPGECDVLAELPFSSTSLVVQLKPVSGRYDLMTVWSSGSSIVEVFRREAIPATGTTAQRTVLGNRALLMPISDGLQLVFFVGAVPTDFCAQWALVSHGSMTPSELTRLAEGLVAR
ncbi:MAG: hypothetical protein AB7L13_19240 [Acidimicrobiia bacterium]